MTKLWHDHPSLDLGIAGILAVVFLNLHITAAGDALSSLERGERRSFYGVLAVLAVVLLAAALTRQSEQSRWCQGCFGFAAATGAAGMLLDVQDGPVATVQLVVLVGLFMVATSTIRLIIGSTPQAANGSFSGRTLPAAGAGVPVESGSVS